MQHDILKLRDQAKQIFLSQRVTKNEMGAKVDSLKDEMKANMDDQAMEDHIEHQQQVFQLLKDNLTLVQNRMK